MSIPTHQTSNTPTTPNQPSGFTLTSPQTHPNTFSFYCFNVRRGLMESGLFVAPVYFICSLSRVQSPAGSQMATRWEMVVVSSAPLFLCTLQTFSPPNSGIFF